MYRYEYDILLDNILDLIYKDLGVKKLKLKDLKKNVDLKKYISKLDNFMSNSNYKEIEIYVLNKQLEKNQIIQDLDVTKKKIRKTFKVDGLVLDKEDLLGKLTKVRIKKHRPIYFRNLKKKWLIEKNSKVIVENNSGPITIKVDGIAMENGDYSDKIKVKNLRSNEILVGFVVNKKKITLNPKQF